MAFSVVVVVAGLQAETNRQTCETKLDRAKGDAWLSLCLTACASLSVCPPVSLSLRVCLQPFWPMGTGIARGFLAALDSAWMVRRWSGGGAPLDVLAERSVP